MAETPIILRITDQQAWSAREIFSALSQASMRLPTRDKERLLELTRGESGGEGKKGGYVVDDVMRNNVFHVTVAGVDHTGLYPDVAVSLNMGLSECVDGLCY